MSSFWDAIFNLDSNKKNQDAGYRNSPYKATNDPNSDYWFHQGQMQRQAEIEREREAARRQAERDRQWEEEQQRRRNNSSW